MNFEKCQNNTHTRHVPLIILSLKVEFAFTEPYQRQQGAI